MSVMSSMHCQLSTMIIQRGNKSFGSLALKATHYLEHSVWSQEKYSQV